MALLVGNPLLHSVSLTRNSASSSSSSTYLILGSRNKNRIHIIRFPVNELSYRRCYRLCPVKSASGATASSYELNIDDDNNSDDFTVTKNNNKAISTVGAASEASKTISAGSFSRLKAHKIRSLALKTAKTIHNINHRDNDKVVEESVVKPERLEQERLNVSKFNKTVPKRESHKRQDMGRSESVLRDDGAFSRASSTSLRGWDAGRERSNRWVRSEYGDRTKQSWKAPADNSFFSQKSFREVGCNDNLIEFLRTQQIKRPSHIQALAFASVLGLKSCIIADQSGSGKTLAYLLPVIQRIRQEELEGLSKSLPQSPRVVILVPTAELACQVLGNCRRISKYGVPFRSMVATGGFSQKTQLESLQQNLDVVIATPGRFMFLVREGLLKLSNLTCAILDEVDILFNDEDYDPALQSLIKSSHVTTQYLFVTATLPTDIYNKLVEVFPDCEMIMGPGMHRTSPGLEEILVDCSGDEGTEKTPDTAFDNKKSALLKLVNEIPVAKTIIFCNKIETCRKVENVLKRVDRKGIHTKILPFHSALAKESQLANMEEFCSPQLNTSLFLVCTDRASRGIDFEGVDHVVLFDYPRDPSEYVRRVGRTARGAGRKGKAFVFVVGKQVSLARRVIERNSKGHPLHDLPCVNYDWI